MTVSGDSIQASATFGSPGLVVEHDDGGTFPLRERP